MSGRQRRTPKWARSEFDARRSTFGVASGTRSQCASILRSLLATAVLLGSAASLRAQWITQSFDLVAGWNAVYLHVDATHAVLDDLMAVPAAQPIEEIWQWNAALPAAQFVQSPAVPVDTGTPWTSWVRGQGPTAALKRLTGNTAYLVRVAAATPTLRWNLQGKPVAPRYDWTVTGLNFLGFPTLPTAPPSFQTFLKESPALLNRAEITRYPGGPLGVSNPSRLHAFDTTPVRRGEAFWIRAGDLYNRYFGPISVELPTGQGLHFGDASSARSLRVRNTAGRDVTVTLALVSSEVPPSGQPPIHAAPPVLVRGPLNTTNLTFGYSNLSAPHTWTLKPAGQPGAEIEIVLGVHRQQMPGQPGDLFAAVLRLTDSLNLTRIDLPVSATVASKAGLWVGAASVTQVRHYLKQYEMTGDGQPVQSPTGAYQVAAIREDLGDVGRPYPLRLILHTDANGGTGRLLQRVYVGTKPGGVPAVATREELLDPALLADARRISTVHLPWSAANDPWPCMGVLDATAGPLVVNVDVAYTDTASNPFLHTYHPDHDNRNETFDARASRGDESYDIRRQISMTVLPPEDDFTSLTRGHNTVGGEYAETITLTGVTKPGRPQPERRTFEVRGIFSLNRLTDIPELTTD